MRSLGFLLFSLSFFGNFLLGNCVYLSNQVSDSICEQHRKFTELGELQQAVKSGSGSVPSSEGCGWYQVKKGKDAGCAGSIASFIECRIIEQRQSQDLKSMNVAKTRGSGRIVGGENAKPHEFPSIISNTIKSDDLIFCASTLISAEWVKKQSFEVFPEDDDDADVRGGHCGSLHQGQISPTFQTCGRHDVFEGDEDNPARQRRGVVEFQVHEKYEKGNNPYDIAVMKVDPPFELNDKVQVAILPDPEYRADGVFTVCGWGALKETDVSRTLQKVAVPFVDDESCNTTYSQFDYIITQDMICAGLPEGGKDACQGDSGGPMYKIDGDKQTLVGIVSWGEGCARPGVPGVYTEVAYFVSWIKKHACME